MEELMSLAEAADELGIAAVTLRAAIARGRFEARLFGKTYVTTKAEVERYRRDQLGRLGRPPIGRAEHPVPRGSASSPVPRITSARSLGPPKHR